MPTIRWDGTDANSSQDQSGINPAVIGSSALDQGYYRGSLTRGLAAYYPLDGDATDATPLGNDGTNNGASFVSGYINQAVSFSTDTDITVSHSPSITFSGPFTVAFWTYLNSGTDNDTFLRKWASATGHWTRYDTNNNGVRMIVGDGSNSQNLYWNSSLPTGSWQHVVFTFDGTTGRAYLNGSPDGSTSMNAPAETTNPLYIGDDATTSGRTIDGQMDEVRLYDRALSQPEISALYDLTSPSTVVVEDTLQ